jgi:hypothetical protein
MKAQRIEISAEEAEAILERVQDSTIAQEDYEIIKGMVETLLLLNQAVTEKNTSIKRLLQVIFGYKTEKKKKTPKKKFWASSVTGAPWAAWTWPASAACNIPPTDASSG